MKRSIAMDVRKPEMRPVLDKLIAWCVLVCDVTFTVCCIRPCVASLVACTVWAVAPSRRWSCGGHGAVKHTPLVSSGQCVGQCVLMLVCLHAKPRCAGYAQTWPRRAVQSHSIGSLCFLSALSLLSAFRADVICENFRPGVMERLGLGYEACKKINDKIIFCSNSGFGPVGEWAKRPSFDLAAQAFTGDNPNPDADPDPKPSVLPPNSPHRLSPVR